MNHELPPSIPATISLSEASERLWDVVVIGAGPAGALAAMQLAESGLHVLLVDKRAFPRDKVCGGCFSARAVQLLESVGLGSFPIKFGVPLDRFCLSSGRQTLEIPLSGSWAMTRHRFDAALVRAAIERGVAFVPEVTASVAHKTSRRIETGSYAEPTSPPIEAPDNEFRFVVLDKVGGPSTSVAARVVLAADGLGSPCTAKCGEFSANIYQLARIGVGATLHCSAEHFAAGVIYMSVSRSGYVGLVRLDDQSVHLAAALDPSVLRQHHNTHQAISAMLGDPAWWPSNDKSCQQWHGTLPLTRTIPRPASWRILLIGDAAGYVEPFTGEGITWALECAITVKPLVERGVKNWTSHIEQEWTREHRARIRGQQRWCRGLTRLLRYPAITRTGMLACQFVPGLTNFLTRRILEPA